MDFFANSIFSLSVAPEPSPVYRRSEALGAQHGSGKMGVRYFAAAAALASLAALTLTACGPKTESGQSAASSTNGGVMGGLFPASQAPYKATYKIGDSGQEMVIYASNGKMRSEAMITAMGKLKPVSLIDRDAKQF